MGYCALTDLIAAVGQKRLEQLLIDAEGGQLTDSDPTAWLAAAIERADAAIDEALEPHYAVPVASPPVQLKALSIRATLVELSRRRLDTYSELDKTLAEMLEKELTEIRGGRRRITGLTVTRGLPAAVGSLDPHTMRPYTEGTNDPATVNSGLTDPNSRY